MGYIKQILLPVQIVEAPPVEIETDLSLRREDTLADSTVVLEGWVRRVGVLVSYH